MSEEMIGSSTPTVRPLTAGLSRGSHAASLIRSPSLMDAYKESEGRISARLARLYPSFDEGIRIKTVTEDDAWESGLQSSRYKQLSNTSQMDFSMDEPQWQRRELPARRSVASNSTPLRGILTSRATLNEMQKPRVRKTINRWVDLCVVCFYICVL